MTEVTCKVESITSMTDVVHKVLLQPQSPFHFQPGQYLQVVMGEGDKRPFSIASAPSCEHIELHIGAEPGNNYAGEVLARMKSDNSVIVEGGNGNAWLRQDNDKPIILMAGGTGFSYAYGILKQLLEVGIHQPVFLYWGTRQREDMYAIDELQKLDSQHSHFRFIPVIEHPDNNWQGRTGRVHQAVLADFVSLEPYQVYVAGRFEMAGVARQDFIEKGLHRENLFGDAYEFI